MCMGSHIVRYVCVQSQVFRFSSAHMHGEAPYGSRVFYSAKLFPFF